MTTPIQNTNVYSLNLSADKSPDNLESSGNNENRYSIDFSQLLNGRKDIKSAGPQPPQVNHWTHLSNTLKNKLARAFELYKQEPDRIKNPAVRNALDKSSSTEEWVNNLPNGAADAVIENVQHYIQAFTYLSAWADNNFQLDEHGDPTGDPFEYGETENIKEGVESELKILRPVMDLFKNDPQKLKDALVKTGLPWDKLMVEKLFDAYDKADKLSKSPKHIVNVNGKVGGYQPVKVEAKIPAAQPVNVNNKTPGYTSNYKLKALPPSTAVRVDTTVPASETKQPSWKDYETTSNYFQYRYSTDYMPPAKFSEGGYYEGKNPGPVDATVVNAPVLPKLDSLAKFVFNSKNIFRVLRTNPAVGIINFLINDDMIDNVDDWDACYGIFRDSRKCSYWKAKMRMKTPYTPYGSRG